MVTILARAAFSQDMAETLHTYFGAYERDGVVTIEVTDRGLWLFHPHSRTRQFLGLARLPEQDPSAGEIGDRKDAVQSRVI